MTLLVHLVALVLAFALCWRIVTLLPGLFPPATSPPTARAFPLVDVLLIVLCLAGLVVLSGEFGLWGTWGAYRRL